MPSNTMNLLQRRIDSTAERIDAVATEVTRRKLEELARADAEQARANAEQSRADAWRNRELGGLFDSAFEAHGQQTPQPIADERPSTYRRRLYEHLRRKLPDDHDLAGVRADELPSGTAYLNFEKLIIDAATAEGVKPSVANLPDGLISRTRVDDMGERSINWYGKESYIKGFTRPGRHVQRIVDRRTGNAIWGEPFSSR